MLTVTFIRHAESEDNLKAIYAGWKDAPLSNLGKQQAAALGKSLENTKLDMIYASPLKRAYSTAQAVLEHQPSPKPLFKVNPNLREQHFGIAEGYPWRATAPQGMSLEEMYENKIFVVKRTRGEKFPEGESLNDLARRADVAVKECVLPNLEGEDKHIAVVSHGLCIGESIAAVLRLDPETRRGVTYAGLLNTAWTRLRISKREAYEESNPVLGVMIVAAFQSPHLDELEKELPSDVKATSEVDEKLSEARAYFGGAGTK